MQQQFAVMLEMQDRMNRRVHPEWIDQDFAWYRALWIECGELLEHYGYKWWKRQQPDMEQVRLEIVDIWHFGMSMLFDTATPIDAIAAGMQADLQRGPLPGMPLREAVEDLAAHALTTRRFCVRRFWRLLEAGGLDETELFRRYVGKNVLNFFRQDHGYQDGSYRKIWLGREDNEHLSELCAALDSSRSDFPDRLYEALLNRYMTALEEPETASD
jgi:hypothetical protein